ncbi:hypothetical protein AC629_36175, partial [Bradyrhizobium sp. NAS80.1]
MAAGELFATLHAFAGVCDPKPDHIALRLGTSSPTRAFFSHAHDIKHHPGWPPDRRLRRRDCAGPARPDAAATDRAAVPAT